MENNLNFLVDSHCHLIFDDYKDDIEQVIERAFDAGVKGLVVISTQEKEFDSIINLSEKYENIYCSIGIHPHSASEHKNISVDRIIDLSKHDKVIGIGETGLDFFYENSEKEIQINLFKKHIKISRETRLPLIIHTRDADEETCGLLENEYKRGKFSGLIHCFTAGQKMAEVALNLGFYISLSGIVTFKNASELRETIKDLPLDRIIVETDSPYLSPEPLRGKRNEPSNVVHTAKYLANFYQVSEEDFFNITTSNFLKIFKKAKKEHIYG